MHFICRVLFVYALLFYRKPDNFNFQSFPTFDCTLSVHPSGSKNTWEGGDDRWKLLTDLIFHGKSVESL